jgi:hypothetical protein
MHLLLIVALIITFPLDQVLQEVVVHAAVQYLLELILFLTVDESCGWGWHRSSANDGIRERRGQFDHREYGVEAVELGGGRARQYAPWPTQASMTKGPRRRWDSLDDGLLVVIVKTILLT